MWLNLSKAKVGSAACLELVERLGSGHDLLEGCFGSSLIQTKDDGSGRPRH